MRLIDLGFVEHQVISVQSIPKTSRQLTSQDVEYRDVQLAFKRFAKTCEHSSNSGKHTSKEIVQ